MGSDLAGSLSIADAPPRLLLRADADSTIGIGHGMRCLALAQAWLHRGGRAALAASRLPARIETRFAAEGIPVWKKDVYAGSEEDCAWIVSLLRNQSWDWLVLDGYHFEARYVAQVQASGVPVLLIDDLALANSLEADCVLNQNLNASSAWYDGRICADRLLAGSAYALLRREFWSAPGRMRRSAWPAEKLLITMGGADPLRRTGAVLEAIQTLVGRSLEVRVVIGPAFTQPLPSTSPVPAHKISFLTEVQDVAAELRWADLVISAAGGSCWEIAAAGVPAILIVTADNQMRLAAAVAEETGVPHFDWRRSVTSGLAGCISALLEAPVELDRLGKQMHRLTDGLGALRVADALMARVNREN